MRRVARTCALALLAYASGCGGSNVPSPFEGRSSAARSMIRIDAENQEFSDATLYVITSASRQRMGTVQGKSADQFQVQWPVIRPLQIEIDLLAGGRFTTNAITVSPGDRVMLLIRSPLNQSFLRR